MRWLKSMKSHQKFELKQIRDSTVRRGSISSLLSPQQGEQDIRLFLNGKLFTGIHENTYFEDGISLGPIGHSSRGCCPGVRVTSEIPPTA